MKKNFTKALLLIVVTLELTSFFLTRQLAGYGIFYSHRTSGTYLNYLTTRDPVVGWPSLKLLQSDNYSKEGARAAPLRGVESNAPCIAAYKYS